MHNKDFRVNKQLVWALVIINVVTIIAGSIARIQHAEFSRYLLLLEL